MKIAFLIAAHQHPELLSRMISRLQSPFSSFFVHIDRRTSIQPFRQAVAELHLPSLHWAARQPCRWATFDQVKVSLTLLRLAMEVEPTAQMFILLSGQDYPLCSIASMVRFFEQYPGMSFLRWARLPWSIWPDHGGFDRLTHFHFHMGGEYLEYPCEEIPRKRRLLYLYQLCQWFLPRNRTLPSDIVWYGGLSWWNLTRGAVESVFNYLEANPRFVRNFRFTKCSDEIFFQTILLNSSQKPYITNDDLRCVFWDGRRHEYPALLRPEDFAEIRQTKMFFARKIHPVYSRDLLDRIDLECLGLAPG